MVLAPEQHGDREPGGGDGTRLTDDDIRQPRFARIGDVLAQAIGVDEGAVEDGGADDEGDGRDHDGQICSDSRTQRSVVQ
jgi:hypothetical protein